MSLGNEIKINTVGELREALKKYSDDTEIGGSQQNYYYGELSIIKTCQGGRVKLTEPIINVTDLEDH